MTQSYFITGTDTDVGKTIVTAGLLRWLRRQGVNAASMKPAQTGAILCDGLWVAPDLAFHHAAANFRPSAESLAIMAPYCYEPACSPHLAGRMAGRYPDLERIAENAERLQADYDLILVEGAGGIFAPLTETETIRDLMVRLALPVILVAHRGLGTINHTLLSIEALRGAGLAIAGIVFNETQNVPPDFIKEDNPRAVAAFGRVDVLGNIDFLAELETDPEAAWARFEQNMPGLDALLPQRATTQEARHGATD